MIVTIQLDDENPDDRTVLDRVVKAIDRLRAKEEADAFDALAALFTATNTSNPPLVYQKGGGYSGWVLHGYRITEEELGALGIDVSTTSDWTPLTPRQRRAAELWAQATYRGKPKDRQNN